ncbi:MAG: OmpP1/FadL family transporter, partial [Planctomycetaceae bacterium]
MRHCRIVLSLSWILLALSGRAVADGVIRDSVSATSSGRGGANIAHSDNGAVLLSNPAGIINAPGRGLFEASLDTLYTELGYEDPQNSVEARNRINLLPEAAGIYKSRDGLWAAGVGVFVPAGFTAEWEMAAPAPFPGREKYYSLGTLIKVLPGAAVRLTERLSVGATVGLAFSQIELDGPFFVQSGMLRGAPTLLKLNTDGLAPTWSIGAQYQLSERTTFGVVYSSETRFELEGDARATIIAPPAPVMSDFDAEVDIVWPRSIGAGVTHWINCRHRVSLDVLWFDWSDAFDQLDLTLSNPSFAPLAPLTP